jgi:hypothetical protein
MTPDERKTNIEKILGLYRIIEIAAIGVKGRLPMQIVAATDDISFQKLEKLQSKGDGIYFRPTSRDQHNVIFIDDVPYEYRHTVPGIIVTTSPAKCQMHVPLSRSVATAEAREVQGMYCREKHADRGCSGDIYHYRRLPGFVNRKYPDHPEVYISGRGDHDMEVQTLEVVPYLVRAREKLKREARQRAALAEAIRAPRGEITRDWQDYYDGDKSRADIRYALHLLNAGRSPEEVGELLRESSPDLDRRKRGHVASYITRTVTRAMKYKSAKLLQEVPT